ncbi:protein LITTLE ZIPPER 2 isoform X1 [Manihot esculenta]|uniref:protein LITTLE ZIPPER 2 isoform X1 n=1 Tax=Manihot esculenta TaxID=3983 RepID=UPI001CC75800|nr:protein LITTLE ZIPPER 2 isoform X1 [Manihot esculenta]
MCMNRVEKFPSPPSFPAKRKQRSKKPKVQVLGLSSRRGCQKEEGEDMELKNLKLYLENQSIVEENEKLRKKANLLHQENLALMSEFEKKFPHLDRFSTTLSLLHNKH